MNKVEFQEEYTRLLEVKEYWNSELINVKEKLKIIDEKIQRNLEIQNSLEDYENLWEKYKKSPMDLTDEEKDKLAVYIKEIGYLDDK